MVCKKCGVEDSDSPHHALMDCVLSIYSAENIIHIAEFFPLFPIPIPADVITVNNDIVGEREGRFSSSAYYFFCFRKKVAYWYTNPEAAIRYGEELHSSLYRAVLPALRHLSRLSHKAEGLGSIAPTADRAWIPALQQRDGAPAHTATPVEFSKIPYPDYFYSPGVKADVIRTFRPVGLNENYSSILLECLGRVIGSLPQPVRSQIIHTSPSYPAAVFSLRPGLPHGTDDKYAVHISNVACSTFIAAWNLYAASRGWTGLSMLRKQSFGYATPSACDGDSSSYHIRFGVGAFDVLPQAYLLVDCTTHAITAATMAAGCVASFLLSYQKAGNSADDSADDIPQYLGKCIVNIDHKDLVDWNMIILEAYLCAVTNPNPGNEFDPSHLTANLNQLYRTCVELKDQYSAPSCTLTPTGKLIHACCRSLDVLQGAKWKLNLPQHPFIPKESADMELSLLFRRAVLNCTPRETRITIRPHPTYRRACERIVPSNSMNDSLFGCYMHVEYELTGCFISYLRAHVDSDYFQYDSTSDTEDSMVVGQYFGSKRMFLFARTALDFIMGFIRNCCGTQKIYKVGPGTYFEFETFAEMEQSAQSIPAHSAFIITPNAYPESDATNSFLILTKLVPASATLLLIDTTGMEQDPKNLMRSLSIVLSERPALIAAFAFSSDHKVGMWGFDRFALAQARILTRDLALAQRWKYSLRGGEENDPIALLGRMWRNFLSSRGLRSHLTAYRSTWGSNPPDL